MLHRLPLFEIEKQIQDHTEVLKSIDSQQKLNFPDLLQKCITGNELLNYYFLKYDPVLVSADNLTVLHGQISELLNIIDLLLKDQNYTENPFLTKFFNTIARLWANRPGESSEPIIQKVQSRKKPELKQQLTSGIEDVLELMTSARKNLNYSRFLIKNKEVSLENSSKFIEYLDVSMKNLRESFDHLMGLQKLIEMDSENML